MNSSASGAERFSSRASRLLVGRTCFDYRDTQHPGEEEEGHDHDQYLQRPDHRGVT